MRILRLNQLCKGGHRHIVLRGKAPAGRNWTSIASSYWPAFVQSCLDPFLESAPDTEIKMSEAWRAGMGVIHEEETVQSLVDAAGFVPAGEGAACVCCPCCVSGKAADKASDPTANP